MKNAELEKHLIEIKENLVDLNNLLVTLLNGLFHFEEEEDGDDSTLTPNLNKPTLEKPFDIDREPRGYIG